MLRPPSDVVRKGDRSAAKASYESTMEPAARDAISDFTSRCEGKGASWRPTADGPAVRLEWREAAAMSMEATSSMAHMSLTLHDTYDFNFACAVDGSFLPSRDADVEGQAAWAVWWGVTDDDEPRGEGGALPEGASIADAEMTAVSACMETAEREAEGGGPPRLLIVSDCTAVMQSIQAAWDTGSAWHLRSHHRQALLERILLMRARWLRNGGTVIFQWTPAHRGVYPNHYADVLAKAYLGRELVHPFDGDMGRQASLVQYGRRLSSSGRVSWVVGDHQLLQLMQSSLARYALEIAVTSAAHDTGSLIIYTSSICRGDDRVSVALEVCMECSAAHDEQVSRR